MVGKSGGGDSYPGENKLVLARFRPEGGLDGSFGVGGVVRVLAPGTYSDEASAVRLLGDGRIQLAGLGFPLPTGSPLRPRVLLARFQSNGNPDTSFDGDGFSVRPWGAAAQEGARALALESNGRATVAGFQANPFAGLIARYNPNGSADNGFGFGGFLGAGQEGTQVTGVALPGDGSTIVAGDVANWPFAARVKPGSIPPSGGDPFLWEVQITSAGRGADITGLAADSSGRSFLAGTGHLYESGPGAFVRMDAMLVALDPNGALDPTFGGNPPGVRYYQVPGNRLADYRAIATAPGGDLVLAGSVQHDFESDSSVHARAVVLRVHAPPPLASQPGSTTTGQPPASRAPASAPATVASFTKSPKSVRVSRTGRFGYSFSATPRSTGKIRLKSTKRVRIRARKRFMELAAKSFTVPATGAASVKFKLSPRNLKALKRVKRLRFAVVVMLTGKKFTTTLTLRSPKKPKPGHT